MADAGKLLYALLVLSIFGKGMCGPCSLSDIKVTQSITGNMVLYKTECEVEVSNSCLCPQKNVRLTCVAYSTVEKPDPVIFRPDGPNCLVNNGGPILSGQKITFRYAWDTPTDFPPANTTPACA